MNFSGLDILVVGDLMLDHYISGTAARVSPEAPVPVVSRERSWTVPGGAANVARGLARLGCNVRLAGIVGSDQAGDALRKAIAAEGIKSGIIVSRNRPTSCKTRIMAQGQQLLRLDEEVTTPITREDSLALQVSVDKLMPGCGAVILSDYAKGTLTAEHSSPGLCPHIIRQAAQAGAASLVDPKGTDWARYAGAQCVTPNSAEFAKICQTLEGYRQINISSSPENAALARDICDKYGIERLLLTRGAKGMILFEKNREPLRIRATMREVADVSGAGDTVIATLAACVAKGLGWDQSSEIANIAAGIAVTKIGTAPVDISELNTALREESDNPKLYSRGELAEKIGEWRSQGQSIVFTNGCFDLLHPGHISLLRKSAAFGDRLVIGLNSDSSVRRLKGATRPIQNEQSRALLLSAIQFVDAITIFGEDTPEELIRIVRPDTLVKGSDYTVENVVGADFVKSYGGQTRLVDLVDGFSTTKLERQIGEAANERDSHI